MFSVALIGPDGAGKTTVARHLESKFPGRIRYIYMGVSVDSANVALPTTRLAKLVKEKVRRKSGTPEIKNRIPPDQRAKSGKKSGKVRAALRLANRLAEEWYRQFLSWNYRRTGHIVLYDRHYKFDYELEKGEDQSQDLRFSDWLHRWCLANLYPTPDLVVYLDAPAEVLFARKGEFTLEWLESRRQAFLQQGGRTQNFVIVDATQPLDTVIAQVADQILHYQRHRRAADVSASSTAVATS